MRTANDNVVRGRSYENFHLKICHTKVLQHENFQIYSICTLTCKNVPLLTNLSNR